MYKEKSACRICEGSDLSQYLDLGEMPLVNRLVSDRSAPEPKFPLSVMYCNTCSNSQLSGVVDPSELFRDYVYCSSISQTFSQHCADLASTLQKDHGMRENDLVIDIASNDGCLLQQFLPYGVRPLGVDPARNLARIANEKGIQTIEEFWTPEIADTVREQYGSAKIITATNVFAHVDDVNSFVRGIKNVLSDDGTFVVEVPYFVDLVQSNIFDTVYHEHLSYFLLEPLQRLFSRHDLGIIRAERQNIHGGSLRLYVQHRGISDSSVEELLLLEEQQQYHDFDGQYRMIGENALNVKRNLVELLKAEKQDGKIVAGFGASAKGCILLNYCGFDSSHIPFVVDDTPLKQGKFMAGTHIPILSRTALKEQRPDYLLVLAWNFFHEIRAKTGEFREQGGKYILPIPTPHIVE